jgi:hypothetical protein
LLQPRRGTTLHLILIQIVDVAPPQFLLEDSARFRFKLGGGGNVPQLVISQRCVVLLEDIQCSHRHLTGAQRLN